MDPTLSNTIAWLVPEAGNRRAAEAARLQVNSARRFALSPCFDSATDDTTYVDPKAVDTNMGVSEAPDLDLDLDLDLDTPYASDKENAEHENDTLLTARSPRYALSLTLDDKPKSPRGFVVGADPKICDIVLPRAAGIARRHCLITFDRERRLVLRDTSKRGTAVWYDGRQEHEDCRGNSTGAGASRAVARRSRGSWLLSSGSDPFTFPSTVSHIIVDIQGVRFQVVVNACLTQSDSYQDRVDQFLWTMATRRATTSSAAAAAAAFEFFLAGTEDKDKKGNDGNDAGVGTGAGVGVTGGNIKSRKSLVPSPLRIRRRRPIFVKCFVSGADQGAPPETYLWNTAKPWEPLVKVETAAAPAAAAC